MAAAPTRGGADVKAVATAQVSLDDARRNLDAAVRSLGRIEGGTVMADSSVVALVLRVNTARRHLEDATRPTKSSDAASLP